MDDDGAPGGAWAHLVVALAGFECFPHELVGVDAFIKGPAQRRRMRCSRAPAMHRCVGPERAAPHHNCMHVSAYMHARAAWLHTLHMQMHDRHMCLCR